MALSKRACITLVTVVILLSLVLMSQSLGSNMFFRVTAESQNNSTTYPQIQNFAVTINQSESSAIFVPINNSGSPLNWTGLRINYVDNVNGIKISTDPLLYVDALVLARSDNYSLRIGISVSENVSVGVYTIPFTLTARSSLFPPYSTATVNFNVIITVLKSPPRQIPLYLLFIPFILIATFTMIGIVIIWSRDWNVSEVRK